MTHKEVNPILRMRLALGWSQTKCAKLAGISQTTWSQYERLKDFLSLRPASMIRVATAFKTDVEGMILEWQKMMGEENER